MPQARTSRSFRRMSCSLSHARSWMRQKLPEIGSNKSRYYTRTMPAPAMSPRLFRVMGSDFWNDEVMLAPQTHTDARLADVARLGFDGVWIHAELRQLAPTALFAK